MNRVDLKNCRCVLIPIVAALTTGEAGAVDRGQWPNATQSMREWFQAQKSAKGYCCSLADGYPAEWRGGKDGYEVRIDGQWVPVPADTILYGTGNPTGGAVVWFGYEAGAPVVRCFVPGDST